MRSGKEIRAIRQQLPLQNEYYPEEQINYEKPKLVSENKYTGKAMIDGKGKGMLKEYSIDIWTEEQSTTRIYLEQSQRLLATGQTGEPLLEFEGLMDEIYLSNKSTKLEEQIAKELEILDIGEEIKEQELIGVGAEYNENMENTENIENAENIENIEYNANNESDEDSEDDGWEITKAKTKGKGKYSSKKAEMKQEIHTSNKSKPKSQPQNPTTLAHKDLKELEEIARNNQEPDDHFKLFTAIIQREPEQIIRYTRHTHLALPLWSSKPTLELVSMSNRNNMCGGCGGVMALELQIMPYLFTLLGELIYVDWSTILIMSCWESCSCQRGWVEERVVIQYGEQGRVIKGAEGKKKKKKKKKGKGGLMLEECKVLGEIIYIYIYIYNIDTEDLGGNHDINYIEDKGTNEDEEEPKGSLDNLEKKL